MATTGSNTSNPAGSPKVTPVAPSSSGKPEAFQAFENLTRKVLRVPKSEVDEKRQTAS
jgi:hypothetical protein